MWLGCFKRVGGEFLPVQVSRPGVPESMAVQVTAQGHLPTVSNWKRVESHSIGDRKGPTIKAHLSISEDCSRGDQEFRRRLWWNTWGVSQPTPATFSNRFSVQVLFSTFPPLFPLPVLTCKSVLPTELVAIGRVGFGAPNLRSQPQETKPC